MDVKFLVVMNLALTIWCLLLHFRIKSIGEELSYFKFHYTDLQILAERFRVVLDSYVKVNKLEKDLDELKKR